MKFGNKISLPAVAGDIASPADGDMWYNTVSNKARKHQNGVTSDLDASGNRVVMLAVSGTDVITTGGKPTARVIMPFAGTITGWKIICDTSCTITLDVWKHTAAPTNANSITASAKPSVTAGITNNSTTLTGWTTSVSEGDILQLEVEANDNAKYIALQLIIN